MMGWIKLHRELKDHWINEDSRAFHLWINFLMEASHKERKTYINGKVIKLKPGQLVFGRKRWSRELKIDESKIYRTIKLLKESEMIKIDSTNKYSIITILNWEKYQKTFNEDFYIQNEKQQSPLDKTIDKESLNKDLLENKKDEKHEIKHTEKHQKNLGKKDLKDDISSNIPYFKIKDLFNAICISLPRIIKLTDRRKKKIKERWIKFKGDIKVFKKVFLKVQESSFCKGNNNFNWKVTIDWLIDSDINMIKVLEGTYDERKENTKHHRTKFHNFTSRTKKYTAKELEEKVRWKFDTPLINNSLMGN
ncbi:MAG: hypothetical protein FH751_07375 [Firmicutes bacterium]|nr:hypothetical protein [Bacillota bacterium]